MAGIKAFREAYLATEADTVQSDYGSFEARQVRYALYWAFYESTAYRNLVHKWAHAFKVQYGLYKHTRSIYNPAWRLGEFWRLHIWGGRLDMAAGDGVSIPSALPIVTDRDDLRRAIATLWRTSNWEINKDICALWGAVKGDVAIRIIDDTERQKVYLKITDPATIEDVTLDDMGNVKGYILNEDRPDPKDPTKKVIYREKATRSGDDVVYRTYLADKPYAWGDDGMAEWKVPYGFIPMVLIQHNNAGKGWGLSEFHAAHSKFREVDDISSKLSDQIRKMVDSPWLMAGVPDPRKQQKLIVGTDAQPPEPPNEKSREEAVIIYAPAGSSATPLVSNLNIADTTAYILEILKGLEKDYPELALDMKNLQGDISGKALRIHQMPVADKVDQRRPNYDNALVRAQQMAVAIGGYREYVGFEGFDLDSYGAGLLDHQIGERPVFKKDELDDLENEEFFWKVAKAAKENGMPLDVFLSQHGWDPKKIEEVTESPEFQARLASLQIAGLLGDGQDEINVPDTDED